MNLKIKRQKQKLTSFFSHLKIDLQSYNCDLQKIVTFEERNNRFFKISIFIALSLWDSVTIPPVSLRLPSTCLFFQCNY